MKLTTILLLVGCLHLSASSYSQTVTLTVRKYELKDVFRAIQAQTEYRVVYNVRFLEKSKPVTISVTQMPLEEFLSKILSEQGLTYNIREQTILIGRANSQLMSTVGAVESRQERIIRGKVTDEAGNALEGVTVTVKGTTMAVTTDSSGEYRISIPDDETTLVFTVVGFELSEQPIADRNVVDVRMKMLINDLNEVVVVGYGSQKKVNLTGAVSVVDAGSLEGRPLANATQSLQGLSPGLNVNVGGNTKPGQSFDLNIRGVGNLSGTDKPYVLVDGLEMPLSEVNPTDIESISILKDASASAIYGSRAAYGVILVTTKRGAVGKSVIRANVNAGLTTPVMLPQMVNSADFARFFNAATYNALGVRQYSEAKIQLLEQYIKDPTGISIFPEVTTNNYNSWENSANGVANTNWFDLHYKPYTSRQQYNVSASGGNENTQYYVSGGFYNEGGILRFGDVGFKRYSFNANVSSQLNPWVRVKANTKYTESDFNSPFASNAFEDMFFHNMARMRPNVSPYDLNGNFNEQSMVPYLQSGSKKQENLSTLALLTGLEVTPLPDWKINIDLNMSRRSLEVADLLVPGTIYSIDGAPFEAYRTEYGIPVGGSYGRTMENDFYISPNIYTNYQVSLGDHHFGVTMGYQQELNRLKNLNSSVVGLISYDRPGLNLGTGEKVADEIRNHWATQGFFGRLTYNFQEKWLLEINGRYDGSSRFAPDHHWGFFPSVSAGYNISNENFFKDHIRWVDQLKIRGSYGFLGNQAGADLYAYIENMNVVLPRLRNGGHWYFRDGRESYIEAPLAYNPFITWEKVGNANIGLDFSMLHYRLSGSLDVYQRNTRDMLGPSQDVADMYGATPPQANNADLRTRGWELSVKWADRIGDNIRYHLGLMVSDYKSVVTKYQNPTGFDPANAWYEGKVVGEIWGYRADGLLQSTEEAAMYNSLDRSFLSARDWMPGDVKYVDLNADGKLDRGTNVVGDMGDQVIIGNTTPRYAYSINGGISWKNIDMSILLQGIAKWDYSPAPTDVYFWGAGSLAQVTVFKEHLDYWTPENPDAYYPNPYASAAGAIGSYVNKTQLRTDRYLQNAAYLRLKNLTIGYSISKDWLKQRKLGGIRLFLAGENLLTFTPLPKMLDPETLRGRQTMNGAGKIYPLNKVYSFGLSVSF